MTFIEYFDYSIFIYTRHIVMLEHRSPYETLEITVYYIVRHIYVLFFIINQLVFSMNVIPDTGYSLPVKAST